MTTHHTPVCENCGYEIYESLTVHAECANPAAPRIPTPMNKPRLCKRCKVGVVSEQSWAQSGRLCPPCVEIVKADIIQAIEADTPRLQRLLLDMRQDAGNGEGS